AYTTPCDKAIAEDEKFCKYMAVMTSLPFQYGFTNKRWERAIDVILEKKSGERKTHLMRIIGLVEVDFNTALEILFTQRLMANSELAGLSSNQWGGRANRSVPDCTTSHYMGKCQIHEDHSGILLRRSRIVLRQNANIDLNTPLSKEEDE
ncbi:LOW QUALITY PROTEIN: hypothetical protein ACHAWF_000155, partial [Thalassiosira exigua]